MKNVRHLFKTLGGGYSVFPPLFSVLCFLFFFVCVPFGVSATFQSYTRTTLSLSQRFRNP